MSNVVRPEPWWSQRQPPTQPPEPPDMEHRVARLESLAEKTAERLGTIDGRLVKIEARLDEFTRHYATKADLTAAKNSIIVWVVSAVFLAQLLPVVAGLIRTFFG